jgi:hypothetical protein
MAYYLPQILRESWLPNASAKRGKTSSGANAVILALEDFGSDVRCFMSEGRPLERDPGMGAPRACVIAPRCFPDPYRRHRHRDPTRANHPTGPSCSIAKTIAEAPNDSGAAETIASQQSSSNEPVRPLPITSTRRPNLDHLARCTQHARSEPRDPRL